MLSRKNDLITNSHAHFAAFAKRGFLHEVFSVRPGDALAAISFVLGLIKPERLVWLRQELVQVGSGVLYAPGLATLGLDPSTVIFASLRDATAVLNCVGRGQHGAGLIYEKA